MIFSLIITNATLISVQYDQSSCDLLLGNLFRLISKLQSFDFPLLIINAPPSLLYVTKHYILKYLEIYPI